MSFGDLVYSLFKSNPNNTNVENSIAISQGKEYKSYKFNNEKNIHFDNNISNGGIEGFSGMIGPTSVNTKNQNEQSQLQNNEDKLNRKISSYANSQRNLMEKTQQYLQNDNRKYGKNVYALEPAKMEDIKPSWVGCYKTKNDGLIEQTDLGNNASVNTCKVRASDLGYSTFSLRQDGKNSTKCYVGNNIDKAQSGGLSTVPVVSHEFSTSEGANIGGLLMNGQIGVYEDDITTNLTTDLKAVENCDISIGGMINTNNTVATYGYNCNGTAKSKFTAPPSQPKPEMPTPRGYKKYSASDGTQNIMRLNTTDINKIAEVCNKNTECLGFNNVGYLKKSSTIEKSNKIRNGVPIDLYMKIPTKEITIDTSKTYRLKNINSTKCLYSNEDGRFGNYTCIDFDDQYWNLEKMPEKNTYRFTDVNSKKSLYNTASGKLGVADPGTGAGPGIGNDSSSQHWTLIPVENQDNVYQFKNINSQNCLYNNADGRFRTSACNQSYNDQFWKLIPIEEGPKKCDQYKDTDKKLPNECLAQIWKETGCTTDFNKAFGNTQDAWLNNQTKSGIASLMKELSTDTSEKHRTQCYAPVPVIKTGSTINTGSLWSKPWSLIKDNSGSVRSLTQIKDGTILCTGTNGDIYSKNNYNSNWGLPLSNSCCVSDVIQLQDGRYLGIGSNDNKLYIKNKLTDIWDGLQINQVTEQTVFENNGTVSCDTYCHGQGNGYSWNNELPKNWKGAVCVGSNLDNNSCSKVPGFRKGLECKCKRADNKPYAGTNANTTHIETPDPDTCCVISITQLSNGALIGVGTDNYLYKREKLSDKWKQIKCPSSCCVTNVSTLSDGYTIVGVGLSGYIYTIVDGQGWTLVDKSKKMLSVIQLKDGTIIGAGTDHRIYRK